MWHLGLTIWTKLALRLLDDVSDYLGRSLSDRRSFNDAKSPPGGDAFKAGRQRNCTRITWIIKQPKWSRDVDTWRWHSSCGWLKIHWTNPAATDLWSAHARPSYAIHSNWKFNEKTLAGNFNWISVRWTEQRDEVIRSVSFRITSA